MSSGHVFAVRADLTHLACDDIVVPTDRRLHVTHHWLGVLDDRRPRLSDLEHAEGWEERRCARLLGVPDDGPRIWLVNTGGNRSQPVEWYIEAVRNALEAIAALDEKPRHGRERRLTALPLVGVGEGGASAKRGEVIGAILDLLDERAAAGQDVALVLWTDRDHAAAQHVRRPRHEELPDETQEATARALADRARRRELALFLGAGVSASAGLPLWKPLLRALLDRAGVDPAEAAAIGELEPRDAATLAVRKLGGPSALPDALRAILTQHRYGMAHALLAALPVAQTVTTNYDELFETARRDQGRPVAVLPFEEPAKEWLLKVHGDLGRGKGIVLTRDDYLRFGERSGALAGVVQGMLMTKHVLFAGFSLTDENFFRMAHATRQALDDARCPRVVGTATELQGDPVKESLWGGELDYLAMGGPDTATPAAARRLEIFFDRVVQLASDDVSFLLDPVYDSLKSDTDRKLADDLLELAGRIEGDGRARAQVEELLRSLGGRADGGPEPRDARAAPRLGRRRQPVAAGDAAAAGAVAGAAGSRRRAPPRRAARVAADRGRRPPAPDGELPDTHDPGGGAAGARRTPTRRGLHGAPALDRPALQPTPVLQPLRRAGGRPRTGHAGAPSLVAAADRGGGVDRVRVVARPRRREVHGHQERLRRLRDLSGAAWPRVRRDRGQVPREPARRRGPQRRAVPAAHPRSRPGARACSGPARGTAAPATLVRPPARAADARGRRRPVAGGHVRRPASVREPALCGSRRALPGARGPTGDHRRAHPRERDRRDPS